MFGMMGVGKSTFSNTLLGGEQFKEGEGAETVTEAIQVAQVQKPGGGMLNVFDVPGLGDPDETQLNMAKKFVNSLSELM